MPEFFDVKLTSNPGMEYGDFPTDIWLPYHRRKEERYVCVDGTYRFSRYEEDCVYWENDDDPEGDLEEEFFKIPEGYVAWKKVSLWSAVQPQVGDAFRVICPTTGEVLFTEVIEEIREISGWKCALAKRSVEAAPASAVTPEKKKGGDYVLAPGVRIVMKGDSIDWGIDKDYNVRLDTFGTIEETPAVGAKKVLVTIEEIDGDGKVTKRVKISKCRQSIKANMIRKAD